MSEPTDEAVPTTRRVKLVAPLVVFGERHPLWVVFAVALLLRAALAGVVYFRFGGAVFGDDFTYFNLAMDVVVGQTANWDDYTRNLFNSTATFTLPLTALLALWPSRLAGQLLVALAGAATAVATTTIARRTLPPRWALLAGLVVGLLPSQILWSSLILKDAFVWAVLSALAVSVARLPDESNWVARRAAMTVLLSLSLLGSLRLHTLTVALWALVLASLAAPGRRRLQRIGGALLVALFMPVAFGIGLGGMELVTSQGSALSTRRALNALDAATAIVPDHPQAITALQQQFDRIVADRRRVEQQLHKQESPDAGACYTAACDAAARAAARARHEQLRLQELERLRLQERELARLLAQARARAAAETSLGVDVAYLPTGLRVMLLDPLPWRDYRNPRVNAARWETLLWYPMLMAASLGLLRLRRHAASLAFPFFVGSGIVLMYALSEGNFGTAFRHRGEFVWVVALLAAHGVFSWRERRSAHGGERADVGA